MHIFKSHSDWKKHKFGGVNYHYLHIKAKEGKATFLLLHGFPNGPSNYTAFIPYITGEGYGVVLPELLGYGETDKPTNVDAYAFNPMCAQLNELLDHEGVSKVVVVGHDFGGPLAARFTQFHPDKILGLVLGGAPYAPPSPVAMDVDAILKVLTPALGYENIGYFKFFPADHAPKVIEEHLDSFLSIMFGPPAEWKDRVCKSGALEENLKKDHKSPIDPWLSEKDLEELKQYLKKNGLEGPCMWFRAAVAPVNIKDHGTLDPRVKKPYLYISPSMDPSYPAPLAARQAPLCDDLTSEHIKTGHWIYAQDPKRTWDLITQWGKEKNVF